MQAPPGIGPASDTDLGRNLCHRGTSAAVVPCAALWLVAHVRDGLTYRAIADQHGQHADASDLRTEDAVRRAVVAMVGRLGLQPEL